jgi:glyoxylase-like metal-dependent hydrolase (beta-lactamase superfamily II)
MALEPVLPGLWRGEARHPEWVDGDGWPPDVAWWFVASEAGAVMVDPLVTDWDGLDALVDAAAGCAAVVRTCHWHQRSIAEVAARYRSEVFAMRAPAGVPVHAFDRAVADGDRLPGGVTVFIADRQDEIGMWLPEQRALLFGDVFLRDEAGRLSLCPDSWTEGDDGPQRMRAALARIPELPIEHVLVSHGPLVLGGGTGAFRAALA